MATERPGTSNLRMNAVATAAISSRSGAETSSSAGDLPHPDTPENGTASTEAERIRFIATLLVTSGMKRLPKQTQVDATSGDIESRGNITMRPSAVKQEGNI